MRRFGQVAIFPQVLLLCGGFLSLDLEAADGYRVIGPDGRGPTPGYSTNPDKDFRDAWSTKGGYNPAGTDWGRTTTPYSDPLGSGAGNWKARPATPAFGGAMFQPQMPQYPSQNYSIGSMPRPLLAPETPKFSAPKQSSGGWATGGTGVKFPDYPSSSGSGYRSNSRTTPNWEAEHIREMKKQDWEQEHAREMKKQDWEQEHAREMKKYDANAGGQFKSDTNNDGLYHDPKTGETLYEGEMTAEMIQARAKLERQMRRQQRLQRQLEQIFPNSSQASSNVAQADYWRQMGYEFDPQKLSAQEMDQKAQAIRRAAYWKDFGYSFNPDEMTAPMMDRVGDALLDAQRLTKANERAAYWKGRGYFFDAKTMTAAEMDAEVERREKNIDARGTLIKN